MIPKCNFIFRSGCFYEKYISILASFQTDEDFDDDFEGEQDDVEQRMDEVINEDLQDMANTKFGDDRMTKWMREQER